MRLTSANREVLTLLAQGKTESEIADLCASTRPAVCQQVKRMKDKLGAATTAGLVVRGIEEGYIPITIKARV